MLELDESLSQLKVIHVAGTKGKVLVTNYPNLKSFCNLYLVIVDCLCDRC